MRLKAPNSEQKESMDFLFRTRNQHKDNFIEWLYDCREAAIKRVIAAPPEQTPYTVGELSMIDDFIEVIKKF